MLCPHTVIIVKTVALKTPNSWAVKVTDAPANALHELSLTSQSFHRLLVLNTAEYNLHYTNVQTTESRQ